MGRIIKLTRTYSLAHRPLVILEPDLLSALSCPLVRADASSNAEHKSGTQVRARR